MSQGSPFPINLTGSATANYEHSNATKHLILEYRSDEFEICKPKKIVHKPRWYSKAQLWLVHYVKDGEPDIRLLE